MEETLLEIYRKQSLKIDEILYHLWDRFEPKKTSHELYFVENEMIIKIGSVTWVITLKPDEKREDGYRNFCFLFYRGSGTAPGNEHFLQKRRRIKLCDAFDDIQMFMEGNIKKPGKNFSMNDLRNLAGQCKGLDVPYYYEDQEDAFYFMTRLAFWKIRKTKDGFFFLEHAPFDEILPKEKISFQTVQDMARPCRYHNQKDAGFRQAPAGFLDYAVNHDKAKAIIMKEGIKNLPSRTNREKKYKQMALNKKKRSDRRHVMQLFDSLKEEQAKQKGKRKIV